MFTIAVVIGSLRKESFNKKLFAALNKLEHPKLQFTVLALDDVPIFNQDKETPLPSVVAQFKETVNAADAVLFITPEYNRSIPGMLKNVIDWGTRPYGQNCWANKPTAIIGTSQSSVGTAIAQSHLRSILPTIKAILLPLPEIYLVYKDSLFDQENTITDENTKKFLQNFLNNFEQTITTIPSV